MLKYTSLFIILLASIACKQQQKAATQNNSNQNNVLIFSLKTTPCYGECPVYDLTLYSDSTLVFEGKQYTQLEGTHKSQLNEIQYETFFNLAKQVNWDTLNDEYKVDMTDLPSSQFYYDNNGNPREIYKYGGEPKSLSVLEKAMLAFVEHDVFGIEED